MIYSTFSSWNLLFFFFFSVFYYPNSSLVNSLTRRVSIPISICISAEPSPLVNAALRLPIPSDSTSATCVTVSWLFNFYIYSSDATFFIAASVAFLIIFRELFTKFSPLETVSTRFCINDSSSCFNSSFISFKCSAAYLCSLFVRSVIFMISMRSSAIANCLVFGSTSIFSSLLCSFIWFTST